MTNPKCGDCAKFQKSHKTVTSTGWYKSACYYDRNIPKHIPESQKDKYVKEYLKLKAKDDICDDFLEDYDTKEQKTNRYM